MARRMRFGTWCRKDENDETLIVYTFRMKEIDGTAHTVYFTSDDPQSFAMLSRIRYAWVDRIERITNEFQDAWNVVLYED